MIRNPDYNKATNAAYEILRYYTGFYPQIEILKIIRKYSDIAVHTYSELASRMKISISGLLEITPSEYGYTVCSSKTKHWIIYYNDTKDEKTIRFTLAHELGHVIMEHICDDEPSNCEANCFARNILCPAPIIEDLQLKTCEEYCSCFNISEPMAEATKGNHSSDMYYISRDNYNIISFNYFSYMLGYKQQDRLFGF